MIAWQMADKLDGLIIQKVLSKIPRTEFKLREQLDSASDSIGSNFVEGYYANSLPEYIKFCGYSKRSIAEIQQRMRRILRKGYITNTEYEEIAETAGKTMYIFDRLIDSLTKKRIEINNKSSKA